MQMSTEIKMLIPLFFRYEFITKLTKSIVKECHLDVNIYLFSFLKTIGIVLRVIC